jgi:CBS domain-containing protein
VVKEYADFLGSQPPYDALTADELLALVSRAEVEYVPAGKTLDVAGTAPGEHLWVVRTGALDVIDQGRVVDHLGPGDTFGYTAVLSRLPVALTVRAAEDTLCLRLPDPRTVLSDTSRLQFTHFGTFRSQQRTAADVPDRASRPVTDLMRPIVWSSSDEPISAVARRIGDAAHSCALVRYPDRTMGIVTDRDFRERVATGLLPPSAPVSRLASSPLLTVSEAFSQAAAFARMVDRGVHHLVVVSRDGQPVGVLRVVDFASSDIRSPLLIRSAIDDAADLESLTEACQLLQPTLIELAGNGLPSLQIGNLLAAIIDATLRKLITLHTPGAPPEAPGPLTSWLVLGSVARREPLPGSDVDTALVWAGSAADNAPGPLVRRRAAEVLDGLARCGLRPCPDGANAVNPLFSRPQGAWAEAAAQWLTEPDTPDALLLSSIVIDSRPLTEVALGRTLTDMMRGSTRSALYLHAFLLETLAVKPPTGFVRDFVVERNGEHRGKLSLKRGGLLPIAAIGRFVTVVTGDSRGSTTDRLRRGAEAGVLTQDESDTLIGAFEEVYDLLLRRELTALAAGAQPSLFIAPRELDTLSRRHLRESFRAIAAVQDSVEANWLSRLRD